MSRKFQGWLSLLSVLLAMSAIGRPSHAQGAAAHPSALFNVRDFGAMGDGKTKETAALQKALDTCAKGGGGTVRVPPGVYLTGSVQIGANTTLLLDRAANLVGSPDVEDYPLVRIRWEGEFAQGHRALLCAEKADHIAITGTGSIFGPPLTLSRLRNPRGPSLIELTECRDVLLEGFSTQYQQLWSIHPIFCQDVIARHLTIRSINFNGDGIDVDSCRNVQIEQCDINTGDDAIALKSGRGQAALGLNRPTENVIIRDCTLVSSGFGGIGVGTEMSGGIRHVRIENCTITAHKNAILIKSREGRGGFLEDISGENLTILDSPNFLSVDLLTRGIQASDPVTGEIEKWPQVRALSFQNVTVRHVGELVSASHVPAQRPLDGLVLSHITGDCRKGITLAHMENVRLSDIGVHGFDGPLLTIDHVKGTGLENPPAAPKAPEP